MPDKTKHDHGTFSWADLATSDVAGAKKFYTGLFGWDAEDLPVDENTTYTMFRVDGKDVAAANDLRPDQKEMGIPPHWSAYITVDDVDKITEQARELGAQVFAEPFDVMDVGRMAVLGDPTGAGFNVWQAKTNIGAQLIDEPGSLTWFELATPDMKKAESFYTELFGWSGEAMPGDMPYTMFSLNENWVGGMYELGEDAPMPTWSIYFLVSDLEGDAAKVKELGGQIVVPPQEVPGFGRFALISDPQGAVLGLYERGEQTND